MLDYGTGRRQEAKYGSQCPCYLTHASAHLLPSGSFQSATALQDSGGGAKQRVSAVPGSSAEVDLDGTRDSTELAIVYYVQKFCRTRVAVTREPCGLWRLLEFTVADCVLYKVSIPRLFRNYNHTTCTHNSYEGGSAQGVVRVV